MMKPNLDIMAKLLCMGTAILITSVLSVNPFTLIYAIFLLVSARSVVQIWKDWRIIMFIFYVLDVVVTVIWIGVLTIGIADYFINQHVYSSDYYYLAVAIFVDISAIISLWLVVNSFTNFSRLYTDARGNIIAPSMIGESFIINERADS